MALFTLDSNVLFYAIDHTSPKQSAARRIVAGASLAGGILTIQALGEFFHAATKKSKLEPSDAAMEIARLRLLFGVPFPANAACLDLALPARLSGRFQFWDAMLLATAGAAGCTALISEDMGHGAQLAGVTVVRAFECDAVSPEAGALLA